MISLELSYFPTRTALLFQDIPLERYTDYESSYECLAGEAVSSSMLGPETIVSVYLYDGLLLYI